jgi:hypothetical protein
MVNSEKLIGTTEYMMLQMKCHMVITRFDYVLPYILESNMHPVFGDFLDGKKLVRGSNLHLSFNHPLPTWQLTK